MPAINTRSDVMQVDLGGISTMEIAQPAAQINQTAATLMAFCPDLLAKPELKQQLDLLPGGARLTVDEMLRNLSGLIKVNNLEAVAKQGLEHFQKKSSEPRSEENAGDKGSNSLNLSSARDQVLLAIIEVMQQVELQNVDLQVNALLLQYDQLVSSTESKLAAAKDRFHGALASALTETALSLAAAAKTDAALSKQGKSITKNIHMNSNKQSDHLATHAAGGASEAEVLQVQSDKAEAETRHSLNMTDAERMKNSAHVADAVSKGVGAVAGEGVNIQAAEDDAKAQLDQANSESDGKRSEALMKLAEAAQSLILQMLELLNNMSNTHGQMIASTSSRA